MADPSLYAGYGAAGAFVSGLVMEAWRQWRSRKTRKALHAVVHEVTANGGDNLRARMEEAAANAALAAQLAAQNAVGLGEVRSDVQGLRRDQNLLNGRVTTLEAKRN